MLNVSTKLVFHEFSVLLSCPNLANSKVSYILPIFYLFTFSISSSAYNSPIFCFFMFSSLSSCQSILSHPCAHLQGFSKHACENDMHTYTWSPVQFDKQKEIKERSWISLKLTGSMNRK